MFYRMFLVHKALIRAFNKHIAPIFLFCGILLLHVVVTIGMALDWVFFPSLWKSKVERPIIVVGNPRSGTTVLQRFLVDNGVGIGSRLWKMIYPSLTLQALLKPFMPILEKFSPAKHHAGAAHKTSMTGIETDDPSLMFRYFDGFFIYGFFLSWCKEDLKDLFDPNLRDTSQRDFDWLEKLWKRVLVSEKKDRFVGKLFSLGIRVPRFLERFPDAKILYTVRDPLETVPSGLSLVTGVLDGRFGFWNLPEAKRKHFIERLYGALLELSMRFHADYTAGKVPADKVKVVNFNRLMQDFDTLMFEIVDFVQTPLTPALEKSIRDTAAKQKQFKSGHQYDLDKFGLTEERIRKDYAPIYQTFFS
ncbi:MAG: sulfotransferase [Polyangiaceae bacterium]|nr:sulfotransferase [Polyangiaceae bacterium]